MDFSTGKCWRRQRGKLLFTSLPPLYAPATTAATPGSTAPPKHRPVGSRPFLLVNQRDHPFQVAPFHFVTELSLVFVVQRVGAGHEVGGSPDEEDKARQRPREDGKAQPFHQLAKIVGRGDIVEHPALRQVVPRVGRILAEVPDDVVGVQVGDETADEQAQPDKKPRRP